MSKNLSTQDQSPSTYINADRSAGLILTQSFTLQVDKGRNQLGSGKTKLVEPRLPREIVLPRISATTVHVELVQPIIAGTYYSEPAYLLRLQLHIVALDSDPSLISRIQSASVSVLLEDAQVTKEAETSRDFQWDLDLMAAYAEAGPKHPSFAKTFPGHEDWKPFSPVIEASSKGEVDLRARGDLDTLTISVRRKGSPCKSLLINVADNLGIAGIPSYMTVPLILTHRSLRSYIRISLHARYSFRHGGSADTVPVFGEAEGPLVLDPETLQQIMETEQKSVDGLRVVERGDSLEDIDLETCSSIRR